MMNLNYQMILILCQIFSEHKIKKHETLTAIPSIHIYINRFNIILVLKIKHRYKLKLQTPKSMKLFCSSKK